MTDIVNQDIQEFVSTFALSEGLKGKSVLVTGATGLLGSLTVRCLHQLSLQHQLGIKMICPVRNMEKAKSMFGNGFDDTVFLSSELTSISSLPIKEIDHIIHFAAPTASVYFTTHPTETFDAIVEGTRSVLCWSHNVMRESMVYVSSLEVYGQITDDQESIKEDCQGYIDPLNARSCYPLGKRAAECLCHCHAKEYGTNVSIARLTQTVGAGLDRNDQRIFAQFSRCAALGKDIVLHTEGKPARPYCYTIDAIRAILHVMLAGKSGEAYNVANPNTYISAIDLACYIQQNFAKEINVRIELADDYGYPPTTLLKLDTTKISQLGWTPSIGLQDMTKRIINYIKTTEPCKN